MRGVGSSWMCTAGVVVVAAAVVVVEVTRFAGRAGQVGARV